MQPIYCIAYGSNLHPIRMEERVPSARALGVVKLPGLGLAFHKRSTDGSGKCLLYGAQDDKSLSHGVLYEFDPVHKAGLDVAEGSGKGYFEQQVMVPLNGLDYSAYLYMASSTHIDVSLVPYHWYKKLVLVGAKFHGLPPEYVATIESVASIEDPDIHRRQKNEQLLGQMGVA
jgi:gamma-glutamylcyclotransferase